MRARRRYSGLWFRVLLAAGAALAIALLVQTAGTYRYVSNNLILQEARRAAEERVRNVERAARLSRPQDPEAFRVLLDDIVAEAANQIAALTLLQSDGAVVATTTVDTHEPRPSVAERASLEREWYAGREILVGVFRCRCSLPREVSETGGGQPPPGRLFLEVALYRDGLSAPFATLRRNTIVSSSAALTLLVSLLLIGVRFGAYVRGKQLEVQLDVARQVQRDLLPARNLRPEGVDLAAECRPASQVGGDFYDVVGLPGGRLSFVLGDVSGHGVSAALLMALIHGAMSGPAWGAAAEEPESAAARLNELLLAKSSGERFASLFWCSYDPASRQLRYLNAGHLPGLWLHRTTDAAWAVDRLSEGGPVLGVLAGAQFRTASIQAHDGDLLVLYSDGITEAANDRDDQFGEDRLIAVIQEYRDLPSRAICDAILSAVRCFANDKPPDDDRTLLVVRLSPTGPEAGE